MTLLEARIEEFEQGTWVADLVADQPFGTPSGTFQLPDGSTWIGTKVSEINDRGRYFSKVVGGKACLGKVVLDQFYQGQVSLQVIASAACSPGPATGDTGETLTTVPAGVFLSQYQRLVGARSEVLDAIAQAAGGAVSVGSGPLLWWIGRDGNLQMALPDPAYGSRTPQKLVTGTRDMDTVDVDGSVELVVPQGAVLGALYGTPAVPVRHIRWTYTAKRFSARLFFVPFIFRAPTQTKYDRTYDAKVVTDHGDGTVDVIAYRSPSEGKAPAFQVSNVQLFCGVPGSKVKTLTGEAVTLAFFGGDPQKPFAMSMKQDANVDPTKKVARMGDDIGNGTLQISGVAGAAGAPSLTGVTITYTPGDGSPPQTTVVSVATPAGTGSLTIKEKIKSGSARLLVGDA